MGHVDVLPLQYDGFKYECRIVHEPCPVLSPVIMLGGAFQDKDSWGHLASSLNGVATLVTVDLPGSGTADDLPDGYGFAFLAEAALHTLNAARLPRVNVVGASYGSATAHRLAASYPERVDRLLLLGATAATRGEARRTLEHMVELLESSDREVFADYAMTKLMRPDPSAPVRRGVAVARILRRQLATLDEATARQAVTACRRRLLHRATEPGRAPTAPTLVLTGEHDHATPPDLGRELAASIPGALFTMMEHCDHLLHLERAAEFADLLIRFFGDEPIDELPYCTRPETVPAAPQADRSRIPDPAPTGAPR